MRERSFIPATVLVTRSRNVTFLEVHRDLYGRSGSGEARVNQALHEAGLETLIGSPEVRRALSEQAARAVIVDEEDVMAPLPSDRH